VCMCEGGSDGGCMCVCVCVCVRVRECVRVRQGVRVRVCECECECYGIMSNGVPACVHVCMYICVYVCVYMCVCVCVCRPLHHKQRRRVLFPWRLVRIQPVLLLRPAELAAHTRHIRRRPALVDLPVRYECSAFTSTHVHMYT
jgi:hypothetical protein